MLKAPQGLMPFAFKAAIFDFDGTLALSGDVWNEVDHIFLSRREIPWTPDLAAELSSRGFIDGAAYVIERYGLHETPEAIVEEWNGLAAELYKKNVRVRPGATEYIRALRRQGFPVALATTNGLEILGSLAPQFVPEDLFDVVVYGQEVARNKNYPDIYLETARRLEIEPWGCIVFEDILPGIVSAQRAGMSACAVRTGDPTQPLEELIATADLYLESWEAIQLPG
ncbi:HAD family hydrolase [Olsenella sp. Marseille-QA0557]|uniref:HAD family hydrolase n=1 Tax=Olsenella sp. Marseille-QA0557 TaxID=3378782 RepID=UPI003D139695